MKQNYWNPKRILKTAPNAQFLMIIGERSNGKSYAIKKRVLENAYKKSEQFIVVRRTDLELKGDAISLYFEDMPISSITRNEWETVTRKGEGIYFARDNGKGGLELSKPIGYALAISKSQVYKSRAYPTVGEIILEEFLSESGFYMRNEVERLISIVSTVFRRRSGKVWMIGNTISRICPYFSEWGIKIKTQKQGEIHIYSNETDQYNENGERVVFQIAVELCENSGNNTQMIPLKHLSHTAQGNWVTENVPKLPYKIEDYSISYTFFIEWLDFTFKLSYLYKTPFECIFIESYDKKITDRNTRIISQKPYPFPFYSRTFKPLHHLEKHIFDILENGLVYFSDNLTGADFKSCYKSLKNS